MRYTNTCKSYNVYILHESIKIKLFIIKYYDVYITDKYIFRSNNISYFDFIL